MPEDDKVASRDALIWEALLRTREGVRLAMVARELESQGQSEVAEAMREIARLNEIDRIRLRAEIDALEAP